MGGDRASSEYFAAKIERRLDLGRELSADRIAEYIEIKGDLDLSYYQTLQNAFKPNYLTKLQERIMACPYLAVNNLNRDFIGTKGFSVVFQKSHISEVERHFPFFKNYLSVALQPDCNAFYLNPLLLNSTLR